MRSNRNAPLSLIAAIAILAATAQAATAADKQLTIVSYGGIYTESQRNAYYEPFSASTGAAIISDDAAEVWPQVKAQVEAGNVTWDVVNGETATVIQACETGLLEPFDWSLLDKSDVIADAVQECGVGTIVQSQIIAYNADKIDGEKPASVVDFFDLEKFPGKRGLRKTPIANLEFALMADGVPHSEVYQVLATEEGIDRAFAKLDEIKDQIVWWEASSEPPQRLADGEVTMTTSWSGRITHASRTEGKNFVIVWDGQNFDIDFWAVVKDAPNKNLAMQFIAFATDPQRQAKQMEYISYGPTHRDAINVIPAELASELPSWPDNLKTAVKNDSQFWAENLEDITERFFDWINRG